MKFKMPESLDGVSVDDLTTLRSDALAEAKELLSIDDISDEQLAEAEQLSAYATTITEARDASVAAAAAREEKIAALKSQVESSDKADEEEAPEEEASTEQPDEDPEAEREPEPEATADEAPEVEDVIVPDDISGLVEDEDPTKKEEEAVAATRTVSKAAGRSDALDEVPEAEAELVSASTITASAAGGKFHSGQEIETMDSLADLFSTRIKGLGGGGSKAKVPAGILPFSSGGQRISIASINKPDAKKISGSPGEQFAAIMEAANERNLSGGSLTAAATNSWCAPSEIIWDSFLELEAVDSLLDLPQLVADRGGIQFTKGPQMPAILAQELGVQTEAEADALEEKVCYSVDCPDWEEVRLDAVYFCLTSGILTNAAYPELVRRTIDLTRKGHQLKVNAEIIRRISAAIGAATNYVEVGGGTSDILDALTIQALRLRYTLSMAADASIEVVLPLWAREIVRADLSRRTGVENYLSISDAQIDEMFRVRKLRVQFVRGYQDLDTTATSAWTAFPNAIEALLYPAGSYVALTKDVIELDAIHDSVNTSTNRYTAVFFEEGLAVANTGAKGVKVSISVNVQGLTGFPAVGAGEGVSFAAPAAG